MLSKRNLFYLACLVDARAMSWLLHLLSSADAVVQDNVVAGLLDCLSVIRTFGCSCHLHQISCYLGSDLHLNSVNSPYAYFSSLLMNFVHPKKPLSQSSSKQLTKAAHLYA